MAIEEWREMISTAHSFRFEVILLTLNHTIAYQVQEHKDSSIPTVCTRLLNSSTHYPKMYLHPHVCPQHRTILQAIVHTTTNKFASSPLWALWALWAPKLFFFPSIQTYLEAPRKYAYTVCLITRCMRKWYLLQRVVSNFVQRVVSNFVLLWGREKRTIRAK